jgi:type IV secretion system protein VirB10
MADRAPTPAHPHESDTPPRITDRRRWPAGVMPLHLQHWLIAAVAVVMVAILSLSGPPKPTPSAQNTAVADAAVDPNAARIEDYQRRVQAQAQRLAAEQAQLELTKQSLASSGSQAAGPAARPPASPPPVAGPRTAPDGTASDPGSATGVQPRVADNVVYSRPSPSTPATPQPAVASAATPTGAQSSPGTVRGVLRYRVPEGTVIDTVLTNRLEGSFQGPVNALVGVPVYADDHLVIPAGARVLGDAKPVNTFGQARLVVAFHRILLPGGDRIGLDAAPALNQAGDLGLTDQVDRHYGQIFGASIALGLLAGFTQGQSPAGLEATADDRYRQGVASSLGLSGTRVLDHFLNLLPTVTIREGHRIKVYLTRDLELPAYTAPASIAGGR